MNNKFDIKSIAKIAGLILIGLSLGWLLFGGAPDQPQSLDEHIEQVHTDEEGNVIYTCSMHPSIRENEPGNCPICGMELIPVSEDGAGEESPYELTMSEAATKLADVQTSKVIKDVAVTSHLLPGKVMVDERRLKTLPAHVPGRIEELYINFTGEYISQGERVASIYSPELVSAQKELLEVAKDKERNPSLYKAARNKLLNWDITEAQINQIEASQTVMNNVDIISKVNGYVINKMIEVGSHVQQGSTMFKLADLSKVWVMFDAYESDVANIKVGDNVSFTVEALPGEQFSAKITFVDPVLNAQSRTVSVRAEAENSDLLLKPNMLTQGRIRSDLSSRGEQILVPKSAVLWTGERSVVYVKKPNTTQPTFEFREVVLGQRVGDQYIVKSGLSEGEEVVTNGTFKIDSAAQLAGKASMMNKTPDGRPVRTGHEGHTMEGSGNGSDEGSMSSMSSSSQRTQSSNINAPQAFKSQVAQLVASYIDFKNALVSSKPDLAGEEVNSMQYDLKQVDMSLLDGQGHMIWMNQLDSLQTALTQLVNTQDLAKQREQLMDLSNVMLNVVKTFQIEGVYYQQFCPMASNGKGAYWLSEKETINNPYFGEQMISCGETIERIENQ
ncbi:efflux RND transporter periplasmic adaptor subunit [Gracilimonas sediminicola]|uniref:Efflux RND transporter periplasmic adaptor subunit n=1 Tax=Gracilimonas sediminicola TaxID=2952158 RepID=A0A9X2RC15_9BACT|nr:efflux RND transporter periplasmic adaptor subunit [Gracilimonas sediminicola]MCP9290561.1 efflux RND transporter periplasmic adaptor subunit [Gracilimonas sediminicola]